MHVTKTYQESSPAESCLKIHFFQGAGFRLSITVSGEADLDGWLTRGLQGDRDTEQGGTCAGDRPLTPRPASRWHSPAVCPRAGSPHSSG